MTGVGSDVLLEDQDIGELLVAHWALVHHAEGWLGSVDTHVGLQVAFGGERAPAYLTFEWAFACVYSVVHLEGRLAAQDSVAHHALVGVRDFLFNVLDKGF